MIPITLTLKNFMCYRDDVPPLHFDSIHVACLCGDNGHGKTAILDAITWALWGVARATPSGAGSVNAARMADLVHMGQSEMSVELDFTAGGRLYRVVRRHTVRLGGRAGRTTLELQVATDPDGENFRSISGSVVRDTQALIIKTLNMDFKTFVNTAYLAQGQADLFTTSTPTERKKCLADVLDLSYYQRLSEAANARSSAAQTKISATETEIETHAKETAQKPEHQARLAEVAAVIADTAPKAQQQRRHAETLRAEERRLTDLQAEFADRRRRAQSAENDIANLRRQIAADEKRAAAYAATIADADRILTGYDQLQAAQTELARLDDALSEKSALDRQQAALEQQAARQEERITADRNTLRRRIADDLTPRANRLPQIKERQAALHQRHDALARQSGDIDRQRAHADETAAQIHALTQDNDRLMAQMHDTRQKYEMLKQGDAACPLCAQPLGADGIAHLSAEYERMGRADRASYNGNQARIKDLTAERSAAVKTLSGMEAKLQADGRALAAAETNLRRDEQDALQAQTDLQQAEQAFAAAEAALRDKTFAEKERTQIAELAAIITALDYDAEAHRQTRRQALALRDFDAARHALNDANAGMPAVSDALQTAGQMLTDRQSELETATERIITLQRQTDALPELRADLAAAENHSRRLEDELRRAEVQSGILKNNISRCENLEKEIAGLEKKSNRLGAEKSIFDDLTTAFGKNGIQALVIESAIPQLEQAANAVLGRITENRMHLKLELDESTSEKLEIRIADELGTRDYLTFSGGEAFRINFALRIALSRLLAARADASLPVLFIDEGFGSQDKAGQERMTEAIQSIQDEFQKIIVITHIEQMKEAFPVRIEVSKTETGSQFAIV